MLRKHCSKLEKIIQDFKTEFPDITMVMQRNNNLTFRLPGNIWIYVTIKDWDLWEVKIEKIGMCMDEDITLSTFHTGQVKIIKDTINLYNTANDLF